MSFSFRNETIALRAFEPEDVPALQAYLNHPDLVGRRYIPWAFPEIFPLSRKQVEGVYNRWAEEENETHLAVVSRQSQELIGHAEADWGWDPHCPSVSLVIAPDHQRQGYGSAVINLLLRYLYETTPAHNVSCWVTDWNEPGRRFLRVHGFRESGRMRRAGIRQGRYFDVIIMDILRPEWEQRMEAGVYAS